MRALKEIQITNETRRESQKYERNSVMFEEREGRRRREVWRFKF